MDVDELTGPDVMTHLNNEVARLTSLLQAERVHNQRLMAACALYRSAACEGLAMLRQMYTLAERDVAPDGDPIEAARDSVADDIEGGDELAIPTAADE